MLEAQECTLLNSAIVSADSQDLSREDTVSYESEIEDLNVEEQKMMRQVLQRVACPEVNMVRLTKRIIALHRDLKRMPLSDQILKEPPYCRLKDEPVLHHIASRPK